MRGMSRAWLRPHSAASSSLVLHDTFRIALARDPRAKFRAKWFIMGPISRSTLLNAQAEKKYLFLIFQ